MITKAPSNSFARRMSIPVIAFLLGFKHPPVPTSSRSLGLPFHGHHKSKSLVIGAMIMMFCVNLSGVCLATDVSGQTITVNTVWDASHSPYNLTGTVYVASGAALTIQTGVQVQGSALYVNYSGNGGSLSATGVTFSNNLYLYSGAIATLSGDNFVSGKVYIAPWLADSLVGNIFPANSTVNIMGYNMTSSATLPSIAYVTTYSVWNGTLTVRSGATLNIASNIIISGNALYINDNGSGGSLSATGVTFNNNVYLYAGTIATLSGNHFISGQVYAAPWLAASLVGNIFPANSTVNIMGYNMTSSATLPSIANVTTYSVWNGTLTVRSGATLNIASNMIISGDALYVNDNGSGGSLSATGVTFIAQLNLGSGSIGTLQYDTFKYSGYNYFDGHMLVTVTNNDFSGSKARAQGTGGPINLEGNYWGTTDIPTIRQNKIYDHANSASLPVIDIALPLEVPPVLLLPNLTPYQVPGWSDKIVVTNKIGTNTDSSPLYATNDLYVEFAVINNGNATTPTNVTIGMFIDGSLVSSYTNSSPLAIGSYTTPGAINIGRLSSGQHTIGIVADSPGAITESDETDNTYTKTIMVQSPVSLQTWRQTYFGTTSNSGDAADNADPYHTGIPNLLVFGFLGPNQNPALAIFSQLPQVQWNDGNCLYSFTEPPGVCGITYGAEWSQTLLSGSWNAVTDTGISPQHSFSVPKGTKTKLFMRLKVTSP
jgi:hypothetical protein